MHPWGSGAGRGGGQDWGLLLVWRLWSTLRRAIWVIILEQRQYSGTDTHAFFYIPYTPIHPFPPIFVTIFLPFCIEPGP